MHLSFHYRSSVIILRTKLSVRVHTVIGEW